MPHVLDLEQALLLLEISPPFGKREVQVARRRMAKVWHPDIAPPGKQLELVGRLVDRLEMALMLELLARRATSGCQTFAIRRRASCTSRLRNGGEISRRRSDCSRSRTFGMTPQGTARTALRRLARPT